jgi:hypothetical protein
MLANKDATVEIVGVVRDVFEIAQYRARPFPERCWDHRSDAIGHAERKFS